MNSRCTNAMHFLWSLQILQFFIYFFKYSKILSVTNRRRSKFVCNIITVRKKLWLNIILGILFLMYIRIKGGVKQEKYFEGIGERKNGNGENDNNISIKNFMEKSLNITPSSFPMQTTSLIITIIIIIVPYGARRYK